MSKRAIYMGVLSAVIGALVIAGCGGGSSSSSSSSEASGSENESASESATTSSESGAGGTGEATISAAEVSGLGSALVDSEGMTVYLFTPDKGTTSTCYGGCEAEWAPVIAEGKPTAGEGATSSALGTTERKDGSTQVTYNGHPVYLFAGDEAPGEANGQGYDGIWFVIDEAGEAVEGAAPGGDTTTTETTTTTPSGGGGGY